MLIPAGKAHDTTRMVPVMGDSRKTKAQLLEELDAIRSRLVEFKLDPAAPAQLRPTAPRHDKPAPDATAELEHLYRTAPVGLCLMDTDLCFVRINERLAAINGRPVSEHLGRTLREVTPDIAPKVEPIYRQVIETGDPALNFEVHGSTPARPDEQRDWLVSYYPLKSPDGTVVGVSTVVQDITERKRIEEEVRQAHEHLEQRVQERTAQLHSTHNSLRESEERFRSIFENAAAGMALVEADGSFIQINAAFCRFLGYTEEELLRITVADVTHPGDRNETVAHLAEVRAGTRQVTDLDKRYVRKNGEIVWGHVTAARLPGPQRTRIRSMAMVQAITARKWAEGALRAVVEGTSAAVGEEFFPSLVRHLAAALQVRYAFVSEVHPTVPKRLRLLTMWDGCGFAEPFEYDVTGTPCEKVFAEGLAHYPSGVRETFPEDRWLQDNGIESYLAVPLSDREGNPIGHLGVMHDAPMQDDVPRESILRVFAARAGAELKRKRAGAELRESERQSHEQLAELELLYRTAPLGLCHMDTDLRYLRCNEKLAEINGIPAADHIGRTLREIVPEIAETMEPVYRQLIESGEPAIDVVATGATAADPKRRRHFSACYYPVKSEDGVVRGVSSIVQEITERRQAEENTRRLHNELAHLGRVSTLGEMAATLAHELNQPLAAIANYAEGCLGLLQPEREDQRELAEAMEQVSKLTHRTGKIIQRIRSLARKGEPHQSSVQINDLVREVAGLIEPEARAERVTLELELNDSVPMTFADSIQIQQVLLNLVRNAFEAMKHLDDRERRLTIRTAPHGKASVEVEVRDTGPGLAATDAQHIFDPFFTTKAHGLGMGLTISRSIIDAHHGRLWTEPGAGATFRFSLPIPATESGNDR